MDGEIHILFDLLCGSVIKHVYLRRNKVKRETIRVIIRVDTEFRLGKTRLPHIRQ